MTIYRSLMFLTLTGSLAAAMPAAAQMPATAKPAVHSSLHQVSDYLGAPPPYPEGYVPPKLDPEGLQAQVDGHLKEMFDKAADPSSQLVTMAAAKAAGWGFVSDHFAEIDANRDGFITYGEYKRFLDARSPVKRQAKGEVQVVE